MLYNQTFIILWKFNFALGMNGIHSVQDLACGLQLYSLCGLVQKKRNHSKYVRWKNEWINKCTSKILLYLKGTHLKSWEKITSYPYRVYFLIKTHFKRVYYKCLEHILKSPNKKSWILNTNYIYPFITINNNTGCILKIICLSETWKLPWKVIPTFCENSNNTIG